MSETDGFDELTRLVALVDETLLAHDQRLRELHHTYAHLDANARHLIADVVVDALLSDERVVAYAATVARRTEFAQLVDESSVGSAAAKALRERTPPEVSMAIAMAAREHVRADQAEEERDRLLAAVKYLRACAHLFPHTNTNRDHEIVGLPDDAPGAWCLGCTIAATADELGDFDRELLGDDDDNEQRSTERARQWVRDYESRGTNE